MESLIWRFIRRCPHCGSFHIRRSRPHDLLERWMLPVLLLRPYRCMGCSRRHYNFLLSKKGRSAAERRACPRASLRLPLRVTGVAGHVQPPPATLYTEDLSENGVRFLAPWWMEPGTPIHIEIDLVEKASGAPCTRSMAAHIVRAEAADSPGQYELVASFDANTSHE